MQKTKNMSLMVIYIQETLEYIKLNPKNSQLFINTSLQAIAIMNATKVLLLKKW